MELVRRGDVPISFDPDCVSWAIRTHHCNAILATGSCHRDVRAGSFARASHLPLEANRPLDATTLQFDIAAEPMQAAEGWLDEHRTLLNSEHLVHDPGAKWKQPFAPQTRQLEWRIEIRS
jgi:hypothetical protein